MKVIKHVVPAFLAMVMATSVFSASAFAAEKAPVERQPIRAIVDMRGGEVAQPNALLAGGSHTRYPAEGGVWEYGFWNACCRSYYTMDKSHGSTVKVGNDTVRSIDTAGGKKSIAEKFALNFFSGEDRYYYRVN